MCHLSHQVHPLPSTAVNCTTISPDAQAGRKPHSPLFDFPFFLLADTQLLANGTDHNFTEIKILPNLFTDVFLAPGAIPNTW